MSSETADARALQAEDVVAFAERYGHLAVLGVLMGFMLWTRLINLDRFRNADAPAFSGIDSYYHWRTTDWTVENFPWTMPFDVYTGFPVGNYTGQFGTVYDQITAFVALLIGLGNPTQADVQLAALIVPPVLAVLVALPVYAIATRVSDGNRFAGLVAVFILALSPGSFLARTMTGAFDHTAAEVLFMALAVFTTALALRSAERDRPVWELVRSREFEPLRATALYATLAGLAISLYLMVWPPGVVFVGILGVFFAVHLAIDFVRGVSPDHVAFVGAIGLGIPAIIGFVFADVYTLKVANYGLLQPILAALVAVGCVFMAWLAREWDARGIERTYYPAAIVGLAVAGLVVLAVVLPDLYSTIVSNVTSRLTPIDPSVTAGTVQEARPPGDFVEQARREFGMGLYLFVGGLVLLALRPFVGKRYRAEHTLMIVWGLFLTSMAATQVRFWYYFILPVAILSGYTVVQVIGMIDVHPPETVRDVEAYQVLTIVLVLLVLFVPFAPQIAPATAVGVGEGADVNPIANNWEGSNAYMQANTPEPGNLYGAGNASELDYYGTYDPADHDYDYPDGAYGVMSWWDFGHLITTQGERIPHANPFQQHARSASAYFQAPSEETANEIMDAINAGMSPRLDANGNVTVDAPEDVDNRMPYVMIDYQMAFTKFGAISQWTGPEYTSQEQMLNTQLFKLYLQDTQGMEHYRLIHESQDTVSTQAGQSFSEVKSFERVEGATLSGTVDEVDASNATATVRLPVETNTGRTFTYSQGADVASDGSFEITVPYATDNSLGPDEGYTDTAVTANGSYEVIVGSNETYYRANATVDEPAVYDGESIQVDGFEETTLEDILGVNGTNESTTDAATDGGSSNDGNTTSSDDSTERIGLGGARVTTP
ncbi:oligosaccharyl transferase, archaeosortase A system-associated [Halovivax cerinus]|uniref:dolichyl-phosphooligosaccharide-protein glycotransferase n=1 Tax=Halovivax cerinus TaxID=1487865 RepID=A0ABD5NIX4_9EURY|nr:oligosaccharyl transferase, archaeosortase A system-associated [Halovivax cerinus]